MKQKPILPLRYRLHRGLWGAFWEAVGFLVVLGVLRALGVL